MYARSLFLPVVASLAIFFIASFAPSSAMPTGSYRGSHAYFYQHLPDEMNNNIDSEYDSDEGQYYMEDPSDYYFPYGGTDYWGPKGSLYFNQNPYGGYIRDYDRGVQPYMRDHPYKTQQFQHRVPRY